MTDEVRKLRGDLAVAQNAVRLLVADNQRLRARVEDAEAEITHLREQLEKISAMRRRHNPASIERKPCV